jgi:hypothetical protein
MASTAEVPKGQTRRSAARNMRCPRISRTKTPLPTLSTCCFTAKVVTIWGSHSRRLTITRHSNRTIRWGPAIHHFYVARDLAAVLNLDQTTANRADHVAG